MQNRRLSLRWFEPITYHHRKVQLRYATASLSRLQPRQLDTTRSRRLPLVVGYVGWRTGLAPPI
jgi:hypothetical protein